MYSVCVCLQPPFEDFAFFLTQTKRKEGTEALDSCMQRVEASIVGIVQQPIAPSSDVAHSSDVCQNERPRVVPEETSTAATKLETGIDPTESTAPTQPNIVDTESTAPTQPNTVDTKDRESREGAGSTLAPDDGDMALEVAKLHSQLEAYREHFEKLHNATTPNDPSPPAHGGKSKTKAKVRTPPQVERLHESILRDASALILGKAPPGDPSTVGEGDVMAALSVARALFEDADLDEDRELSVGELSTLLGRIGEFGAGSQGEQSPSDEIRELLMSFDVDGSGTIDLCEFLLLLCEEPFVSLLLPGADAEGREGQVENVLRTLSAEACRPRRDGEEQLRISSLVVLLVARDAFEVYASKEGGNLGPVELQKLLADISARVRKETGLRWVSHPHWRSAQDILNRFDIQNEGSINFPAFMAMLAEEPFDSLLPKSARREIPLLLEMQNSVWVEGRDFINQREEAPGSQESTPSSRLAGFYSPNSPQHLFDPKALRPQTVARCGEQIYEYHRE